VVTLHLAGGGERRIEVAHPRGTPQRPLSDAEMSEKFRSCAAGVLSPEATAAAEAAVAELDRLADVRALLSHLRPTPH
ncbi:MAG: hypothetical protein R3285_10535, partial [Kiloniellales bacterium]|nr:hypothetical protein [Kiloniellales bacterium]